jgi:two-component system cell cycle response regulator
MYREMSIDTPSVIRADGRERGAGWMWAVLVLGSALLAAFALRALTGLGGSSAQQACATWVSDAIGVCAVAVCLWRAALEPDERALWGLAGLGIASWVLGNAYFEHMLASGASLPNPSPADIGYLAFYPLMYLAVIAAHQRERGRRGRIGLWLDGLISAAACAAVATALVLDPVVAATAGESVSGALADIAYPIGDATLLAMLLVTSATVGWRGSRGLAPLAAGMAIFALADSLYIVQNANGTYQAGGVLDGGWLLALILMAAGAARVTLGHQRSAPRGLRGSRAVVPIVGGFAALAVLAVGAFGGFNPTSVALATVTLALVVIRLAVSLRETGRVLEVRAREAGLDALTGLANRRKLMGDLERRAAKATERRPVLLVFFDLDGFKAYNDTFGHNAGDALLIQVAGGLESALEGRGRAYRMGGDEFCALLPIGSESPEEIGGELAAAMARRGQGFSVTASYGCALAPRDGRQTTDLIRRADDEMYIRRGNRRPGAERQVQDALTAVLGARDPAMESHAVHVAKLATGLGERLGLEAADLRALVHGAALHDIGKIAIPEMLLDKADELDPDERHFLQTHPLIAQRIVSAAPALAYSGHIVRSVQERWDGSGYPDGLSGDAIPLASRIIAVCNAYEAMTSNRPHRPALSREGAIAELRRGAGTQFDPDLVEPLIECLSEPDERPAVAAEAAPPRSSLPSHDRRGLEARLDYQADHDLLTGLLNRRRFGEELERTLRYASRYRRPGALLVLDVDNLKLVNDLHGHAAGDAALTAVARAVLDRVRASDEVGRLGGDEFGIALNEADEREALAVAADIRSHLSECEIDPPVRVSGGIALFEGAQELVPDDLLTAADVALFEAKEAGRDEIRVYRGDAGAALGWVQRIRNALTEERFVLYGQPIVELKTGQVSHTELLVRMVSDEGEVIPPSAFIQTAERFGLINDLDRWVTRQGMELAERGKRVTINLSAHSIGDPAIVERVREAMRSGVAPGAVVFEITETAAMSNMQQAREFSERLSELGCEVALDDFGTGFGSFSYLKHLPTRYLKIDVEFVRELASNETDQRVVKSIADVGHSLGKRIIAEGVEDAAAEDLLRRYGVDYVQGLHVGAPERISARLETPEGEGRSTPQGARRR